MQELFHLLEFLAKTPISMLGGPCGACCHEVRLSVHGGWVSRAFSVVGVS